MGLAFPAMGYSLIDGKTYRQINLKPTGFSQDHRGQHAPLHASPEGVNMLRYGTPQGVNMLRNTIRRKKQGGQHPPLWHALTLRKGRWCSGIKGRRWGSACSAISTGGGIDSNG